MENMKCPHRVVNKINTMVKFDGDSFVTQTQEFPDCLKEQCMAYRKHRRVEVSYGLL